MDVDEDLDMQDNDDDGGFFVMLSVYALISHLLVDYIDYDSDYEGKRNTGEVDPYAGKYEPLTVIW